MAYTPTGKPVGRPKTKDYTTISLKMPQALLDRVQRYARLHRQSISELIRDGVEWRITEGDPRGLGVSTPQHSLSADNEYSRNTVISYEIQGEPEYAGMLQEIRTALTRQETQLRALTQALEQRAVVPTLGEYSGNTTEISSGPRSTPQPVREAHKEYGNTILQNNALAFDPARFYLGQLCPRGHDYQETGQSLRRRSKGDCHECDKARKSEGRKAKRQVQPA